MCFGTLALLIQIALFQLLHYIFEVTSIVSTCSTHLFIQMVKVKVKSQNGYQSGDGSSAAGYQAGSWGYIFVAQMCTLVGAFMAMVFIYHKAVRVSAKHRRSSDNDVTPRTKSSSINISEKILSNPDLSETNGPKLEEDSQVLLKKWYMDTVEKAMKANRAASKLEDVEVRPFFELKKSAKRY